jgi:GNAT superfamily N-acetyltransferase
MTTNASQQPAKGAFSDFPHLLAGTHWIDHLLDGTAVLIRPLRAEDREREEDFIRRLSPAARRYRFLGSFREASPALVDQLMEVDFPRRVAFVALLHENGKLREIGVSRFAAATDERQCECAVTVADEWQHRGLGVLLMRHLIDVARSNGYKRMVSLDDASNQPMRELAAFLGFRREPAPDDPARVMHILEL